MKRSTKTVTAFILTLLLIIASPVAAFAATESGSIPGDSTVETVVINVVLPTELNFALDPLGLDVTGNSQIATADYFFVNQTIAPVRVELEVTATATNDAELVSTTSAITGQSDPGITDKLIYFAALGADSISDTIAATTAGAATTDSSVSYPAYFGGATPPTGVYSTGTAVGSTLVSVVPNANGTSGSAVIGFALDAGTDSTTAAGVESLAADNDGVAAFQFYAQLNTYAEWADGDISVTGNYTLVPLRTETYDTYHALEVGLNQYIVTAPEPEVPYGGVPGFIEGSSTATSAGAVYTISKASTSDYLIPFYFGSETITSMASIVSGTAYAISTTHYAIGVDATADNLVLEKDGAVGTAYTFDTASVGPKEIRFVLSNGTTYKFIANMTN